MFMIMYTILDRTNLLWQTSYTKKFFIWELKSTFNCYLPHQFKKYFSTIQEIYGDSFACLFVGEGRGALTHIYFHIIIIGNLKSVSLLENNILVEKEHNPYFSTKLAGVDVRTSKTIWRFTTNPHDARMQDCPDDFLFYQCEFEH